MSAKTKTKVISYDPQWDNENMEEQIDYFISENPDIEVITVLPLDYSLANTLIKVMIFYK